MYPDSTAGGLLMGSKQDYKAQFIRANFPWHLLRRTSQEVSVYCFAWVLANFLVKEDGGR